MRKPVETYFADCGFRTTVLNDPRTSKITPYAQCDRRSWW